MSSARWDAPEYESVSSPQFAWGQQLLQQRPWRGDEVVLDAGCGPGTHFQEILSRAPKGQLVGVDNDPGMVEQASARASHLGPRVRVHHQDLQQLSLQDSFDVIFSNAVLHWVPDHDAVFENFLKHLKPGGELLVQCGGEGNLQRVRGFANQVMQSPPFAPEFRDWSPPWHYEDDASTQERLLIAGFVEPRVSLTPAPTSFADEATLRRFLEAVVLMPYLRRLESKSLRDAFLDQVLGLFVSQHPDRALDYVRLNIRARRSPHH